MKSQRILVISSANIDFVQRMRRVPYSGETIVEDTLDYSYVPGGKGGNSAVAFSRFGADTVFACKLGDDSNAKRLLNVYNKEGIDTRYAVRTENAVTGLASILIEDNGRNRIVVYPGANSTFSADDVEEAFNCYPDAVFLQMEIPDEVILEAEPEDSVGEVCQVMAVVPPWAEGLLLRADGYECAFYCKQ